MQNFNSNMENLAQNPNQPTNQTTILCILDGFGLTPSNPNNAVAMAKMPNFRKMLSDYAWFTLNADGQNVGQEDEIVGNSEVGHMNIGGLKLIPQLSWEITQSSAHNYLMQPNPEGKTKRTNQLFSPTDFYKSLWEEKTEQVQVSADYPNSEEAPNSSYVGQSQNTGNFQTTGTVHIIGLFSIGRIHSDMRHLAGAIGCLEQSGAKKIVLHLISDGRDSDRRSVLKTWQKFESINFELLAKVGSKLVLGSVGGRFYAMDRDKNFDRVAIGISAMLNPILATNSSEFNTFNNYFGEKYNADYWNIDDYYKESDLIELSKLKTISEQIQRITELNYPKEIFDEQIYPCPVFGNGIGLNDDIWLFNFRVDRMRQLTTALIDLNQNFKAGWSILSNNDYNLGEPIKEMILSYNQDGAIESGMIENHLQGYYPIFQPMSVSGTLAQYISATGKTQLHIAETEKYNHVTYFINGAKPDQQKGEDWQIIPSNKVASHAEMPAMKAVEITDYVLDKAIGKYDYIICNYANPDMVGHTGDFEATKKSLEVLDEQLGRLMEKCLVDNHRLVVIADHGNAEFVGNYQLDGKNLTDTEHNPNPVPCILLSQTTAMSKFNVDNFLQIVRETIATIEQTDSIYMTDVVDMTKLLLALENNQKLHPEIILALKNPSTWLSKDQIVDTKIPLWYSGILFLALAQVK
jgi:2,3-bisphosphoglycerate-independent phosphoglycerate mutase